MFAEIFSQWIIDWKTNKPLFFLELIGLILNMSSAILLALFVGKISMTIIFILWLLGSIILAITLWKRRILWTMALMCFYTAMNLIGLINTLT